jgi:hypothetical protein
LLILVRSMIHPSRVAKYVRLRAGSNPDLSIKLPIFGT